MLTKNITSLCLVNCMLSMRACVNAVKKKPIAMNKGLQVIKTKVLIFIVMKENGTSVIYTTCTNLLCTHYATRNLSLLSDFVGQRQKLILIHL